VTDSGAQLFFGGQYYYRQLGELALNLCIAREFSDAHWREYLEGSLSLSRKAGKGPKVSLASFVNGHPNAVQRRYAADFIEREAVRPIDRLAVLTDSDLLRGALTAMAWAMPKSRLRAFKSTEHGAALTWLREIADFDEIRARAVWTEGRAQLGIGLGKREKA
jgi:hypothetical protein